MGTSAPTPRLRRFCRGRCPHRPGVRCGISFVVGPDDSGGPLAPSQRELSPQATEGGTGVPNHAQYPPSSVICSANATFPLRGGRSSRVRRFPSSVWPSASHLPPGEGFGGRAAGCRPYMHTGGVAAMPHGRTHRCAPRVGGGASGKPRPTTEVVRIGLLVWLPLDGGAVAAGD